MRHFTTIHDILRPGPIHPHALFRSLSPKAGPNKAGRSDFRNQRFEPNTGKMRKMQKVPLTPEKQFP